MPDPGDPFSYNYRLPGLINVGVRGWAEQMLGEWSAAHVLAWFPDMASNRHPVGTQA